MILGLLVTGGVVGADPRPPGAGIETVLAELPYKAGPEVVRIQVPKTWESHETENSVLFAPKDNPHDLGVLVHFEGSSDPIAAAGLRLTEESAEEVRLDGRVLSLKQYSGVFANKTPGHFLLLQPADGSWFALAGAGDSIYPAWESELRDVLLSVSIETP